MSMWTNQSAKIAEIKSEQIGNIAQIADRQVQVVWFAGPSLLLD